MDMSVIWMGLGLLILIITNIVLGSINALFSQSFDWKTMFKGCLKGGVVLVCFALVYLAGWLNPEIVAVSINGTSVTLMEAVYLIVFAGYVSYAWQVVTKLKDMLSCKVDVKELSD